MTNFVLDRRKKETYFDILSDINTTAFDIIRKAKKNDKNVLVHIAIIDDEQAKKLTEMLAQQKDGGKNPGRRINHVTQREESSGCAGGVGAVPIMESESSNAA